MENIIFRILVTSGGKKYVCVYIHICICQYVHKGRYESIYLITIYPFTCITYKTKN